MVRLASNRSNFNAVRYDLPGEGIFGSLGGHWYEKPLFYFGHLGECLSSNDTLTCLKMLLHHH